MKNYGEISSIPFEGKDSKNPFSFKYYNPEELIAGKPMREHLKFAMSYWHTIDAEGIDMFGGPSLDKKFGKTEPMEIFRAKADFAFELMDKLGIEYYCFHDTDIAPEGKTVKESVDNFKVMVDYIYDLQIKHGKKLL